MRRARFRASRGALSVVLWAMACEPRDVVVFRGTDATTSNESGAGGGPSTSGGASATGGNVATGGTVASGGAPESGGVPSSGGNGGTSGGGNGSGGRGGPPRCRSNSDCDGPFVCDKPDCSATEGICRPRPLICEAADRDFVCGCDHITYWNDCLRLQHGVAASAPGDCGSAALTCFFPPDCGQSDASCAVFLQGNSTCGQPPPGKGICFVPPAACTSGRPDDPPLWQRCPGPNGQPSAATCLDTCTALQSFGFYSPMPRGSCPTPSQ